MYQYIFLIDVVIIYMIVILLLLPFFHFDIEKKYRSYKIATYTHR